MRGRARLLALAFLGTVLILSGCLQQELEEGPRSPENPSGQGDKLSPGDGDGNGERKGEEDGERDEKREGPGETRLSFKVLWSFSTGDDVYGVALSLNGTLAAVGSYDGHVYLLREREELWRFKTRGGVRDVAMSEDGRFVAAVSYVYDEATVYLLTGDGVELWNLSIPGLSRGVDVDQKGRVAVASYMDRVYLLEGGRVVWSYPLEDSPYGSWDVAFSGDRIWAVEDNGYLYAFSPGGEVLHKIRVAAKDYPYGLASGPRGYVAVVTMKGWIYLYRDGMPLWKTRTASPGDRLVAGYGVAVSGDAELVAVGSWDKNLYIYDTAGRRLHRHPVGAHVNRVDFSGSRLIFGSVDGRAYIAEAELVR